MASGSGAAVARTALNHVVWVDPIRVISYPQAVNQGHLVISDSRMLVPYECPGASTRTVNSASDENLM
jgi:hypothetical protein